MFSASHSRIMTQRAQPTPHTVFNTMPRLIQWIVHPRRHSLYSCRLYAPRDDLCHCPDRLATGLGRAGSFTRSLLGLTRPIARACAVNGVRSKSSKAPPLSVIQEVLAAVRVVKAFGQEDHEQERFVRQASARCLGTYPFHLRRREVRPVGGSNHHAGDGCRSLHWRTSRPVWRP